MQPPSAVVFDLDGTLIDSRGDIVAAVNYALEATWRKPLPAQVIVRYVGDGSRALCARAAQLDESDEGVDKLIELFLDYYVKHPLDFTRWMPGAQESLDVLGERGLFLAICTNKARSTTDAVLSGLGVRTRFRAVFAGGDLSEKKKPSPEPLLHLAKQLNAAPESMVMVGDGPQDIEAARRAGMRAIGVEHGFVSRERLLAARPDVLLKNLGELPEVITRWRDSTARISVRPPGGFKS
jgi:phosphoglycolate phosphatase